MSARPTIILAQVVNGTLGRNRMDELKKGGLIVISQFFRSPKAPILIPVLLALLVAVACGAAAPEAPTPTPTIVPLAPRTVAPTEAGAVPTATSQPAPSPTSVPESATRSVTLVIDAEPENLGPHMRRGDCIGHICTDSLSDRLTVRNWDTYAMEPLAATDWEQVAPDRWRFTIAEGQKFHNGKVVTAADFAYNVTWQTDKANVARFVRYANDWTGNAINDSTFEVVCGSPCPIVPVLITHIHLGNRDEIEADLDAAQRQSFSNGPYMVDVWTPGVNIKYTFFEDYWGPKPQIRDVTWVWRAEAAVRAAMIKVGEADWAWDIEVTNIDQVPQYAAVEGVETATLVIDTRWNANTSNKQFRQALAYAIDCETMMETILQGQGGCRANSYHPGTTGMPADLKPYPYDPAKARQLLKESGFEGSEVRIVTSASGYSKSEEIIEAVIGYWNDVGLDASITFLERAVNSQLARDTGGVPVGATEHPLLDKVFNGRFMGHTNDVVEPNASWSYASCDEYGSAWACFPEEYKQMKEAMGTQGAEARSKALEPWHRWWNENLVHIPVHDIRPVFGFAENLEWSPRPDFIVWPQFMRFTD